MDSILNKIKKIRNESVLNIKLDNDNRHRVVVDNLDDTYSAYYFSVPIYNEQTKRIITPHFIKKDNMICHTGSSAEISIANDVLIKNKYGSCILYTASIPIMEDKDLLKCGNDYILPTTNGIVYKADFRNKKEITLRIKTLDQKWNILSNDSFFSFMRDTYRPFITVASIGVFIEDRLISPAILSYQQIDEHIFELKFSSNCMGDYLVIDINSHEPKLIQDTTVESLHPKKKNAFGEISFIGNTEAFGTQWLYIRPEMLSILDFFKKDILKVTLYLPKLNDTELPIVAYKTIRRFCSFGSNWENKVGSKLLVGNVKYIDNYATLDITNLITNYTSVLGGIVLKPDFSDKNFIAVATGDCYAYTPITEIVYKS